MRSIRASHSIRLQRVGRRRRRKGGMHLTEPSVVLFNWKVQVTARKVLDAAEKGDVAALSKLLKESPNLVNCADAVGENFDVFSCAIHDASFWSPETFAAQNGSTPMHWAAKGGFIDLVNELLDEGANVDPKNNVRTFLAHLPVCSKMRVCVCSSIPLSIPYSSMGTCLISLQIHLVAIPHRRT